MTICYSCRRLRKKEKGTTVSCCFLLAFFFFFSVKTHLSKRGSFHFYCCFVLLLYPYPVFFVVSTFCLFFTALFFLPAHIRFSPLHPEATQRDEIDRLRSFEIWPHRDWGKNRVILYLFKSAHMAKFLHTSLSADYRLPNLNGWAGEGQERGRRGGGGEGGGGCRGVCTCVCAVSYTHLTLPTRSTV